MNKVLFVFPFLAPMSRNDQITVLKNTIEKIPEEGWKEGVQEEGVFKYNISTLANCQFNVFPI